MKKNLLKKILLVDRDQPALRPLTRFSSPFSIRTGIYSSVERFQLQYNELQFIYFHPDVKYESLIAKIEGFIPYHDIYQEPIGEFLKNFSESDFKAKIDDISLSPLDLIENITKQIKMDLKIWKKQNKYLKIKKMLNGIHILGEQKKLYIHKKANIEPTVVFNTKNGPIIIDKGAQIGAFSYLEGPLYIGRNAQVDNARITGGCSIGQMCRLGGEIENSLIQDFSNKHHEGFLGHSIVGKWVNIGALATTSDLKNNYGKVRIQVPKSRVQHGNSEMLIVDTATIKFGSIIGDCVKIAIGTMLNTGTVIDAGSNVFGDTPEKYVAPLSWGLGGQKYSKERFLRDCNTIFERRTQFMHPAISALVTELSEISPG